MSDAECEACAAGETWDDKAGAASLEEHHSLIARLRAEVARLQAEFGRLFSDFREVSLELDFRDKVHTWNPIAETVEGWRDYDKVRSQLGGAAPKESKEQDRKEARRALPNHPDAGVM